MPREEKAVKAKSGYSISDSRSRKEGTPRQKMGNGRPPFLGGFLSFLRGRWWGNGEKGDASCLLFLSGKGKKGFEKC